MAKMNLFFLKNCISKISTPLGTSSVEEKLILERFCRARIHHHLLRSSVSKPHLCATDRLLLAMNWNARTVEAKLVEFELPLFSLSITCPRLVFKKTLNSPHTKKHVFSPIQGQYSQYIIKQYSLSVQIVRLTRVDSFMIKAERASRSTAKFGGSPNSTASALLVNK